MSTKLQEKLRAESEGREFVDTTIPDPKVKVDFGKHYVKNSVLREELIRCKEKDELSEDAVLMFMQIASKLATKLKYTDPADMEDCISFAVIDCINYWRNYDSAKSDNAFAYITSVCKNGFAKGWRKLGKIKCPDSMRVPLNDDIYSI